MEQTNEQNGSVNLTSAVKNLWMALTRTANGIKELKAENKELALRANEIEKLWIRYNELKEQIPVLEEKVALTDKISEENARLKKENYHLQTSLSELREIEKSFRLAQSEFTIKNKLLHENSQTIEELKSKVAEFELTRKEYDEKLNNALNIEAENERLIVELANLNKENEQKTNDILKLTSDLSESDAEVKRLKAVKLSYEETIEGLNKEFAEYERKARLKEEENLALEDKLKDFEAIKIQFDDLQVKHQDLIDRSRNFEIQFNYLKSDFEEKNKYNEEIFGKLKAKEELLSELLEDIENKDNQIKLYKEAESKTLNLIKEKKELSSKIEMLNHDLEDSQRKITEGLEFEVKYKELQTSFDKLRMTNEELQTSFDKLRMTNEELVMANDELKKSFDEIKVTNDQLLNDVSERSKERCDILKQFEQMEKELTETKKLLEEGNLKEKESKKILNIDDNERVELLNSVEKYIGKLEKMV